ncbi:MAG: sulfotransferase domain-containing protein [Ktedonobacteraceae bacterium]
MNTFTNTPKTADVQSTGGAISSEQEQRPLKGMQRESETPMIAKFYRGMTSPLRLLPDFLVIGTQRGGTTSLYHYLEELPCIAPATTKEIHFFDRRFNKGLAWYRGHFPTRLTRQYEQRFRKQAFVTGEASPSYLFHPHVPRRIAKALPHVKLIVLLRNPVDRAYSQYYHAVELGFETLPFEAAIKDEEERTTRERAKIMQDEHYESYAFKHLSYLSRGIYIDQLQTWMSLFPREQFLILKSEDFYDDPASSVKQVLTFLDIPESGLKKQNYKQYNNTTYSSMDTALRKRLVEYFKPHNARLYDFLGVDFGWNH